MGQITDKFGTAFRPYNTDGVPASGPYKPEKSLIQALGNAIEQAIGSAALGSVGVTKTTLSALNGDLAHADGTSALVYADSTDANNDLYTKVGASGTGSWTNTGILHSVSSAAAASATAAAAARDAVRPLFGSVAPTTEGVDGQSYYRISGGIVTFYGPKASGVWPAGVQLTGATGSSGTISIGTTTTLAAGAGATVTNSGTSTAAVLSFGLPKGDPGNPGVRDAGLGGLPIMQDVGLAPNTLDLREMGRFNQRDNAFIASDVMTTAQQINKRRVYTYGHSGFEGTGVTNDQESDPYISQRIFIQRRTVAGKLGTKLGSDWEVFNHGISTQKIEGIAGRFGALPIRVSVTGGSIPASGTVSCTYCAPNPIYPNRSGMMIYGTINGSPVRLTNPSGTVFLEQPPGAAGALTVADLSIFVPTTSGSEYAICMFWLDRNNQNVEATKHIAGQILARMRKVGNDRCIFWGDWPLYTIVTAGQSTIGTTDYINTIAINDYYRTAFPGNFFDIYRFLREDFPYDGTLGPKASTLAGITLTTGAGDTDQTRIANGFIPKSYVDVSNSGDHFNDTGYDTLAQGAIEYFFKPRGWLN